MNEQQDRSEDWGPLFQESMMAPEPPVLLVESHEPSAEDQDQPAVEDRQAPKPPPQPLSHGEAAAKWMEDNPAAMLVFKNMANTAMLRGRKFGMKHLAEVVRWHYEMEQENAKDFKINNNYVAYIGRELIRQDPRLADFIETRRSPHAEDDGLIR